MDGRHFRRKLIPSDKIRTLANIGTLENLKDEWYNGILVTNSGGQQEVRTIPLKDIDKGSTEFGISNNKSFKNGILRRRNIMMFYEDLAVPGYPDEEIWGVMCELAFDYGLCKTASSA